MLLAVTVLILLVVVTNVDWVLNQNNQSHICMTNTDIVAYISIVRKELPPVEYVDRSICSSLENYDGKERFWIRFRPTDGWRIRVRRLMLISVSLIWLSSCLGRAEGSEWDIQE